MDKISNFLPQKPIEVAFFSIIILLFFLGIVLLQYLRTSFWEEALTKKVNSNILSRETFESLKGKVTSSSVDLFLQALPSIFLIIGLLGTFINLENVLLSIDLNNSNDTKLNETLSELGSKFKTSIWGLIANFFFRIVLYRYYGIGLVKIINGYVQNYESKFNENEAHLKEENYQRRQKDLQFMADTERLLELLMQNQLNSTIETNTNLTNLVTIFQKFDNNTTRLTEAGITMGAAVNNMEKVINEVSKTLEETTNSFAENTTKFTAAVKKFEEGTDNVLKSVNESILNFNDTVKNSFKEFASKVSETLEKISNVLTTSTEKMESSINQSIESMKTEVTSMTNVASKMEKINSNLTNINGELQNEIALIRDVLQNTNVQFERLVNTNALYSRRMEELFGVKNGSVREVFSETGPIGSMLKNTFSKISNTIEVIENSTLTNSNTSNQLIKLLSQLTESIKELNEQILYINRNNNENLKDNHPKQGKKNNLGK